jgi:O-antigen/teichoic acid export membrane protein
VNREFLINIAFLVAINLLIKPFYLFGIDRTVQNTVAAGEYGLYFALFNFTFLLQIINDFGIQHFNNRNIARHRQLIDKYFPNLLILKGLLALVFLAIVFLLARLSGYSSSYYPLLFLLGVNQIITSLILFLRSNISGLAFYRTDSIISALDRLLLILICGVLLAVPAWRERFRIEWFVLAQTAALGLTAAGAFLIVRRHLHQFRLRWRPRFWWLLLRQSAPYASVVFLMTVYTRIDGVMIERLLADGLIEADLYASAYRLLDAGNMIGFLFAGLLFPMFARLIKEGERVGSLVRLSLQLLWAGVIPLALAVFFFRTEIMVALYTSGGSYSGQILGLLMISFIAVSGSYIYGTLLGAKGALRAMNSIALTGVVLNVALNLWLIPSYQAMGAAAATCATQFLVLAGQILVARRQLALVPAPGMILRITAFTLLTIAFCFLLKNYVDGHWWVRFGAALGGGFLLALPLRMVDGRYFVSLLRQR